MEYLENGTIETLLQRRRAAGLGRLPNRVLWAIFLCLVRACSAMAYPPPTLPSSRTPKNDKRREGLPADAGRRAPGSLVHGDMNLGNLMFSDDVNPPTFLDQQREHNLVPILKLIDFGEAHEVDVPVEERPRPYDEPLYLYGRMRDDLGKLRDIGKLDYERERFQNDATDKNILDIGIVMGSLMTNDLTHPRAEVMREVVLELNEDIDPVERSGLDLDLFWLMARCLATQAFLRPRLSHLSDLLEYYIENKAYENIVDESDFSIRQMIQSCIYDARGPVGADGSVAGGPDNPLELDTSSDDDVSNVSQEGNANHPVEVSPDIPVDDVSMHDASINDASINDISMHDASINDASINDVSMHDASINDASINDVSMHDASMNDASINDASINDASMHDVSISSVEDFMENDKNTV
ncbi:hypothetical protein F4679DRAFT_207622 [Xylaria curta]|nr:hypothetical protein F4679DRAFT_207622 [Xylaria curta]